MKRMPTEKEIARVRSQYPAGTRVRLISMDDPYSHLKDGDMGTVEFTDDMGQIHVRWDCGSGLALIPGIDSFRRVTKDED